MYNVIWDGDKIIGGEPAWYCRKLAAGAIDRTADGAGFCLVVYNACNAFLVEPGDQLSINNDDEIHIRKCIIKAQAA